MSKKHSGGQPDNLLFSYLAGGTKDADIISRVLVERDDMSSPALLKEGSAPEDGGWAVAASLDRKRDREE
jgi:hypothetical protein